MKVRTESDERRRHGDGRRHGEGWQMDRGVSREDHRHEDGHEKQKKTPHKAGDVVEWRTKMRVCG